MGKTAVAEALTLEQLTEAVRKAAALRSLTPMQPAGGAGTKVFPPTYAGAVYATEKRRLKNEDGSTQVIECVLLDSVQSQANRMEEALQEAVDSGRLGSSSLPVIEVDFSAYFPGDDQSPDMRLVDPVGKVSSLQAPHRIADAILRDSLHKGKPFRQSDVGKAIDRVSAQNATPLFELCPTALLFGMWDSTGPKGGLGAKFERALVAEIVGIDAVYGVKTSSRIDPLGIQRSAGPVYSTDSGGWTLDESDAAVQQKKPVKRGKDGKPSEVNHGNVTPDMNWEKDRNGNTVWYRRKESDDLLYDAQQDKWKRPLAGGVTIDHAEQSVVLSLAALRRLRFPVDGEPWQATNEQRERDAAGRAVLAALGLVAAALAAEGGFDLRSRCLLWPESAMTWDLLGANGATSSLTIDADAAIALLDEAVAAAKAAGLPWRSEPLVLTPSEQLVKLVVKSQQLAAKQGGDAEGE